MSVLAHRVSIPSIDTRNPNGTSVSLNAEEKTPRQSQCSQVMLDKAKNSSQLKLRQTFRPGLPGIPSFPSLPVRP